MPLPRPGWACGCLWYLLYRYKTKFGYVRFLHTRYMYREPNISGIRTGTSTKPIRRLTESKFIRMRNARNDHPSPAATGSAPCICLVFFWLFQWPVLWVARY